MARGGRLHRLVATIMVEAKRRLYVAEELSPGVLRGLRALAGDDADDQSIAGYLEDALVADAARVLSGQPGLGADALVARLVPVTFDVRLDGRVLGLSAHLAADAVGGPGPMVVDLKFGPLGRFHRLSTAGYALAYEATYEVPVNMGCVVGVDVNGGRVVVEKDYHLLDADARQSFVESRDERMRMIYHGTDPGLAHAHPESCPYLEACGVVGTPRKANVVPMRPPRGSTVRRRAADSGIVFPGAPKDEHLDK
jgi:CRISPR-associated protein Csa1